MRKKIVYREEIVCCSRCPSVEDEDTPGAGCASDYYCGQVSPRKKVMGYVEWESDKKPIPKWCPFRQKGYKIKIK